MIPLETIEQQTVAKWLDCNNYTFTHIANESWLPPRVAMIVWKKKKAMWLKPWVPDFMILLKRSSLLFIELKRAKKSLSKVSKEQQAWIDSLNTIQNVQAVACYWAEEAINTILKIENL